MQYIDYIEINGVRGDIPVNQSGKGAPTTSTEGAVAQIYMNEDTGDLYKCTKVSGGVYTWVKLETGSGGGTVTVDNTLSSTSENPVQNKVIKAALDEKQPKGSYITSESDPTVPEWAKAETKPTYTASEVGALPADTVIPPAYTLPVATSSKLGGVKPVSKTSDMTQSVGVDDNGALFTAPGSGGSSGSGDSPVQLIENTDSTNKKPLRSIDSGTYILKGYFTAYDGSTESYTFSTGMLVAIVKTTSISYVQIFYPKNNAIQYLEISDTEVTRKDAKLVNMESVSNRVTTVTNTSDNTHYPTAKAVYDALSSSGIPKYGSTAPESTTEGVISQPYFVIVDNAVTEMYVCTYASIGSYVWDKVEIPSGGGGGAGVALGISGASVGQIAKITAVDESGVPTAWEPVDLPSGGGGTTDGWKKIISYTWDGNKEYQPLTLDYTTGNMTFDTDPPTGKCMFPVPNIDGVIEANKIHNLYSKIPNEFLKAHYTSAMTASDNGYIYGNVTSIVNGGVNANVDISSFRFEKYDTVPTFSGLNAKKVKIHMIVPAGNVFQNNNDFMFGIKLSNGSNFIENNVQQSDKRMLFGDKTQIISIYNNMLYNIYDNISLHFKERTSASQQSNHVHYKNISCAYVVPDDVRIAEIYFILGNGNYIPCNGSIVEVYVNED